MLRWRLFLKSWSFFRPPSVEHFRSFVFRFPLFSPISILLIRFVRAFILSFTFRLFCGTAQCSACSVVVFPGTGVPIHITVNINQWQTSLWRPLNHWALVVALLVLPRQRQIHCIDIHSSERRGEPLCLGQTTNRGLHGRRVVILHCQSD